jgi:hypothetical protein
MSFQVTLFDCNQQPLARQRFELLQNDIVIAAATTDDAGVARFDCTFAAAPGLAIRCQAPAP